MSSSRLKIDMPFEDAVRHILTALRPEKPAKPAAKKRKAKKR